MSYIETLKNIKNNQFEMMYTFFGNEKYLIDQLLTVLKTQLIDPAYADFNEQVIEAPKSELQGLVNGFETVPFFSDKRLVVVKNAEWLGSQTKGALSEDDEMVLLKYFENPSPTSVVVFVCDSVDKRKKLGKALQKHSCFLELAKLDREGLKRLLSEQFKQTQTAIDSEALEYLMFALGYLEKDSSKDLYTVIHQVEQLIAFSRGEKIGKAQIDKIIEKPLDTNIFAFLDAVSDGKVAEAVRIKEQLLSDGLNDIQINSMLFKQIRNLYKTTLLLKKGYSPNQVAEQLGVHPFSAKKYVSQCRSFKPEYLEKTIIQMAELDYRMKTGRITFNEALDLMSVCLSKRMPLCN